MGLRFCYYHDPQQTDCIHHLHDWKLTPEPIDRMEVSSSAEQRLVTKQTLDAPAYHDMPSCLHACLARWHQWSAFWSSSSSSSSDSTQQWPQEHDGQCFTTQLFMQHMLLHLQTRQDVVNTDGDCKHVESKSAYSGGSIHLILCQAIYMIAVMFWSFSFQTASAHHNSMAAGLLAGEKMVIDVVTNYLMNERGRTKAAM